MYFSVIMYNKFETIQFFDFKFKQKVKLDLTVDLTVGSTQ